MNSKPTTCLSDLIALQNSLSSNLSPIQPLSPERLLAAILKQFEKMWKVFIVDGFEPFLDTYLERWIHSYVMSSLSPTFGKTD
jgi:biotin--protein ligase